VQQQDAANIAKTEATSAESMRIMESSALKVRKGFEHARIKKGIFRPVPSEDPGGKRIT
jgi:hypothetical protein